VAVETEAQYRAGALENANGIGPIDLDILAHGFEPVGREPGENEFGDRFLFAGRDRNTGELAAKLRQFIAIGCANTFCAACLSSAIQPSPKFILVDAFKSRNGL
jgi:hypothetical protein